MVWFAHPMRTLPMSRFDLLTSLLSPEQLRDLSIVQSALREDPTCLDRPPPGTHTGSVPNCYTDDTKDSSHEK